jgi:hypothetical protein
MAQNPFFAFVRRGAKPVNAAGIQGCIIGLIHDKTSEAARRGFMNLH